VDLTARLVSGSILALWWVGVPMQWYTLACLWRQRLTGRYPALSCWLGISSVLFLWLLLQQHFYGWKTYSHALWLITPYLWALQIVMAIEGAWVITRHYKYMHPLFAVLLVAFSGVGAFGIVATSSIGIPEWANTAAEIFLFERHIGVYSLCLLLLTRLFFVGFRRHTICRNAEIQWNGVVLFFAADLVGYTIIRAAAGNFWANAIAQYALQGGVMLAYLSWAKMQLAGEEFSHAPIDGNIKYETRQSAEFCREIWKAIRTMLLSLSVFWR
jgi:hypothetical protein